MSKKELLIVPPNTWRDSRSLQSLAGHLRAAINTAKDSTTITLAGGDAKSILEALCQAIHTERGHGS